MVRSRYARIFRTVASVLILTLGVIVVALTIRFLHIALVAVGNLASLPTGSAGQSVLSIVAIGFLAMLLVQSLRTALPLRAWFHETQIRRWLYATETAIEGWKKFHGEPAMPKAEQTKKIRKQARADIDGILRLGNVTDKSAFFNAPIEQVCGQLSAVAEFLLSEPPLEIMRLTNDRKPDHDGPGYILAALAGPTGGLEVIRVLGGRIPYQSEQDADVRGRLGYHIHRSIDQLQISITTHWQRTLRGAATLISFVIAITIVTQGAKNNPSAFKAMGTAERLGLALVVALISGYLASVFGISWQSSSG